MTSSRLSQLAPRHPRPATGLSLRSPRPSIDLFRTACSARLENILAGRGHPAARATARRGAGT